MMKLMMSRTRNIPDDKMTDQHNEAIDHIKDAIDFPQNISNGLVNFQDLELNFLDEDSQQIRNHKEFVRGLFRNV